MLREALAQDCGLEVRSMNVAAAGMTEHEQEHCAYWTSLLGKPETTNETSVTVRLPRQQQFTVAALRTLMQKVSRREAL